MNDESLAYYNAELAYLRELGAEFAGKYPKVAARLMLEADKCADPHVERLLEGFAFLAARVRKKIDDEFPEITDALLGVLYPHFQRPLPSMTIVQLLPGAEPGKLAAGVAVPRGTRLRSRAVGGMPCQFRTAYPVALWPIEVAAARLDPDRVTVPGKPPQAVALLQLSLRCAPGTTFADLALDHLRIHLDGEGPLPFAIYESLCNNTCRVVVRGTRADGRDEAVTLPDDAIRPVGLASHEGMFDYPARSFPGYRLLQEYFAFPEKFLFVDLTGLDRLGPRKFGAAVEVLIFLDRPPRADRSVQAENFRLGCTPAVNLFTAVAEPIRLDRAQYEYPVVPDVHRPLAAEVYSVDEVSGTSAFLDEPARYEPFYSIRHAADGARPRAYWYATRRPSPRKDDPGTEVHLAFVDLGFDPKLPAAETITVRATCTNRDLPARLPFGGEQGDFELEAPGPVGRVRCLRKPTRPLRPPLGRGAQWRLISHLSLNHLSLADTDEGLDAIREILSLYNFDDSPSATQQIQGITRVAGRRAAGRTGSRLGNAVCLGVEVGIEFDETCYVGGSAFLMASVLERFLGLYASINSFSRLVATTGPRGEILKRWAPRTGERTLL